MTWRREGLQQRDRGISIRHSVDQWQKSYTVLFCRVVIGWTGWWAAIRRSAAMLRSAD
jgi:hypothetical protein